VNLRETVRSDFLQDADSAVGPRWQMKSAPLANHRWRFGQSLMRDTSDVAMWSRGTTGLFTAPKWAIYNRRRRVHHPIEDCNWIVEGEEQEDKQENRKSNPAQPSPPLANAYM
jgi:hypothetical protein